MRTGVESPEEREKRRNTDRHCYIAQQHNSATDVGWNANVTENAAD